MSDNNLPQQNGLGKPEQSNKQHEPDRLDNVLLAGYQLHLALTSDHSLVEVDILPPGRAHLNPVYGSMHTAGVLATLDKAVAIAWEHWRSRQSPGPVVSGDA